MKPIKTIFTIGHSTHPIDHFIQLLKDHGVNCVVDVRSTPYSQYASQYNERDIKYTLGNEGIQYIYMGQEFGARRENPELYDDEGKLDFEKTANDVEFLKGIARIGKGVSDGYKIAIMCTEKNPEECHRCILVGRALQNKLGLNVENILADSSLINQGDIEIKLVEIYFPNRGQISLFDTSVKDDEDYINMAYEKRGKEIAYQMKKEQDQ